MGKNSARSTSQDAHRTGASTGAGPPNATTVLRLFLYSIVPSDFSGPASTPASSSASRRAALSRARVIVVNDLHQMNL
jgi:hypothetical protein